MTLAGFDVGLIERIDADDRAGNGRGDLPAEEFLADLVAIGDVDAHDGMTGPFERGDGVVLRGIGLGRQPHIDEQAVLAVDLGVPERLGVDWHEPLAELSGRLREKLLEPGAEIGDARRRHDA